MGSKVTPRQWHHRLMVEGLSRGRTKPATLGGRPMISATLGRQWYKIWTRRREFLVSSCSQGQEHSTICACQHCPMFPVRCCLLTATVAHPGDPVCECRDMLMFANPNSKLTPAEGASHLGLWAILKAPLLLSTSIADLTSTG